MNIFIIVLYIVRFLYIVHKFVLKGLKFFKMKKIILIKLNSDSRNLNVTLNSK